MRCKAPSLLLPLLAPETCQVIQQKAKGKKREIDISYCIRTTVFNDISSDDSQEKNTIPILEEEEQRVVQGQTPSPRSCAPLLLCQQEQRTRRRKRSRHLFRFFVCLLFCSQSLKWDNQGQGRPINWYAKSYSSSYSSLSPSPPFLGRRWTSMGSILSQYLI